MPQSREANYKGVFDGSVGFGDRPAIIVIDLIRAYTTPGEAFFAEGVVEAVRESVDLLAAARRHYTEIANMPGASAGSPAVREAQKFLKERTTEAGR